MKKAAEGLPRNIRKTIRHQLYHQMKKKAREIVQWPWATFPVTG